jgi:hypothetical protein
MVASDPPVPATGRNPRLERSERRHYSAGMAAEQQRTIIQKMLPQIDCRQRSLALIAIG